MAYSQDEIVKLNKDYTFFTWSAQSKVNPPAVVGAKGSYFWEANGKKYIDFSSQLMLANIGHGDERVIEAIKKQAEVLPYIYPVAATEPRGLLGKKLAEITPGNLTKSFFTNGGADAIENAIKIAKMFTGRNKIVTRSRSYHGGTFGAATAGGDPRRHLNGPSFDWIVRIPDPYIYRSPLYRDVTPEEGDLKLLEMIEETIKIEDPNTIAAFLLEGYNGSSGIIAPTKVFWDGIRKMCDRYGILFIDDEVMSGFGRTGKMFACEHYGINPDIMVCAKGLTAGYVPLGAVIVTDKIAEYFEDNVFNCGLTYSGHALACAAALAVIDVYQKDRLIERAYEMGQKLRAKLGVLQEKHLSIGEARGEGLFYCLEIVKNRETREAMSEWNQPQTKPMVELAKSLRENGLSTFVRWNFIFIVPPLIITEEELDEGLAIIDKALEITDKAYEK